MTTDAVGGVWRYAIDLSNELIARGSDVLLASLGPPPSQGQKAQLGLLPSDRLVVRDYALEWMQDPWADVDRSQEWLTNLAVKFAPDVIHLNSYSLAAHTWSVPVVVVAHSCVRSWWRAVHGCAPGAEWQSYTDRVRAGLHVADSIIAPSQFMARAISEEYAVEARRVRVIHNFARSEEPVGGSKEPLILAAGRAWDKAKNLAMLETLAPKLTCPVLIAGGQLSRIELDSAMSRAAIFAHPALYEPFGLAVLEAARAYCALVLADIPSLRELWDGAALFIDPRREDLWQTALNDLLKNDARRAQLGLQAASRAIRYAPASSAAAYLDTYASLLREPLPV